MQTHICPPCSYGKAKRKEKFFDFILNVMCFFLQRALTSITNHSNSYRMYTSLILGLSIKIIMHKMTYSSSPFQLGTVAKDMKIRHSRPLFNVGQTLHDTLYKLELQNEYKMAEEKRRLLTPRIVLVEAASSIPFPNMSKEEYTRMVACSLKKSIASWYDYASRCRPLRSTSSTKQNDNDGPLAKITLKTY